MALTFLPLPPLPAWMHRRRPVAEPLTGNPKLLRADLTELQGQAAWLAAERVAAIKARDAAARETAEEAARASAAAQRADRAEAALELARTQGADLHRALRDMTKDRNGLREQLDRALYGDATLQAIAAGSGEPPKTTA